ncbi:C40 family peptidase [Flexivirga meconopsidis]|uniref:C40 family peptidase n=1 Tax=Flexivirga meconopsidis TaxID=2977121 RepID=UPI00223EC876|nr:C40 family peptidase [Flexivirga meconopsidis]
MLALTAAIALIPAGAALADPSPSPSDDTAAARTAAARADLGSPTGPVVNATAWGVSGWYQRYTDGYVVSSSLGTFTIGGGLEQTWNVQVHGWPTQNSYRLPTINGWTGNAAYFSRPNQGSYAKGAGYAKAGGPGYFVTGRTFAKFQQLQGLYTLGWPTSQVTGASGSGLSGTYERFDLGLIADTTRYGTRVMNHNTQKYWEPGKFGWPSGDTGAVKTINGYSGWAQYMMRPNQNNPSGAVYARNGNDGYFVQGAIFKHFADKGGLYWAGWPTTNDSIYAPCAMWSQQFTKVGRVGTDARWCPTGNYAGPYLKQAGPGSGNVQHKGYQGTAVYMMQRKLGMSPNKVNSSVWGPQTQALLTQYLAARGRPATTTLDASLWSFLGISYPFNSSTWVSPLKAPVSNTRASHINAAIAWGKTQLGADYLWGGTGNPGATLGYDCSGFQLQMLRAGGLNLTRVSNYYDQYPPSDLSNKMLHDPEMQSVSYNNLQVGDLIFYGTYDGSTPHARHVGMYIGNGQTLQSGGTRVQIMPLSTSSWGWATLGAKRPFTTSSASALAAPGTSTPLSATQFRSVRPQTRLQQRPATDTLWQLNSWNASLPKGKGMQLRGANGVGSWLSVKQGQQINVSTAGGFTVILAGGGHARVVKADASGRLAIPAGVDAALLVPDKDAAGVGVDAPVINLGAVGTALRPH